VVELIAKRTKSVGYVAEIDHPARLRTDFAADMNLDTERMPMETPALVAGANVWQSVRRLESELFEDLHHQWPRIPYGMRNSLCV
jgi:hypothetical protein